MARTNTRLDHDLRDAFFKEGKRLDADPETRAESVCWLCDGRIDYNVGAGTAPDSHHLDHYHPVSTHPELQQDPDNFRHSHMLCNQQRGNGAPAPELGDMVPDWW